MNPLIPLEFWIPLMLGLLFLLIRSSRKSYQTLESPWNHLSLLLRTCALLSMGVLLLNPGRFAPKSEQDDATATLLIDRSASMATRNEPNEPSRFEQAVRIATAPDLTDPDVDLRLFPFASGLEPATPADQLEELQADGDRTDLLASLQNAIQSVRADPRSSRGILVLSDGIHAGSTEEAAALALAARAHRIPISAKLIGEAPQDPDLSIELPQTLYTVTAGADRPLHGRIASRNLEPVRTTLQLKDAQGNVISRTALNLPTNTDTPFELRTGVLPKGMHTLTLDLDPAPGEALLENNLRTVRVNAVEVSLNILMLEGVPHWDSKFLTQWLRGQEGIRITTLHRLSDNRWFRVDPGEKNPDTDSEGQIPGEDNEFRNFDIILIGRGLDYLATSRTTAALHAFVKDHGGMIVFTRGRPVTTPNPAIESLLSVRWLNETSSDHLARPSRSGVRAGLFGDLLPGPQDPLWQDLPELRGLHRLRITDGLTTTLMEAAVGENDADPWPALISRRVGHGRVMMINGEGMWHWDFRSDLGRDEKWYGHFWTQLLLWVVQSARFQPGFETSVEWTPNPVFPGAEVEFRVSHRLGKPLTDPNLRLRLHPENGDDVLLPLNGSEQGTAVTRWSSASPGLYGVSVDDGTGKSALRYLLIPEPPSEFSQRIPQAEPLRSIVEASGGSWIEGDIPENLFRLETAPTDAAATEAVWHPHWTQAWIFGIILLFPACDWAMRRRRGLV